MASDNGIPTTTKRRVLRAVIVGGGKGCYELLKLFHSYRPSHMNVSVIGVADPSCDAIGRLYAEHLNISTFDDLTTLLQFPDLDLVIELTGKDTVLDQIFSNKAAKTKVLDHLGALFLWEIIGIQEEKLQLEQRVAALDTMTAVGEMAYRLTHEIRNPLMIAGGTIRRTMTRVDLPHKVRKHLKRVAGHIQEMEIMLSDICDVVRPLNPKFSLVELVPFFLDFCRGAGLEARFVNSTFSCDVEEELPAIVIDPSLLRQAMWHILENCFDADTENDATIRLRVLLCYDCLLIQIEDGSGGISGISTQLALDPFVSTKSGRMGLGLSICRQIILDHKGCMEIWNNARGGVTVTLSIPISFGHDQQKE